MTKRVTVYLPDPVYDWLDEWADSEQRPISNLAAFLLERAIRSHKEKNREIAQEDICTDSDRQTAVQEPN